MIIAAIDARRAYPGVIIADVFEPEALPGNGPPPKVLFAGTRMLGVREAIPKQPDGRDAKTVVTEAHINETVDAVFAKLAEYEVEKTVVTEPYGPPHCQAFAKACAEAGAVPIAVTDTKGSPEKHFDAWPEDKGPEFDGWRTGGSPGAKNAAHVLLTMLGVEDKPAKGESPRRMRAKAVDGVPVQTLVAGPPSPEPAAPVIPEPVPPPSGFARCMGVDPGANVGVVIAEQIAPGVWRQVFRKTIAVDFTIEDDRHSFVSGLAGLVRDYEVKRVVIERVTHMHGGHAPDDARAVYAMRAMGSGLATSNWLGGMIEGMCWSAPDPPEVFTAGAAFWRRSFCKAKRSPTDAEVAEKIRAVYPFWPKDSTSHERDAAGLIVWNALEGASRPAADPDAPKTRRTRKPRPGCTCPPGHKGGHLKGCPHGRVTGTVQKCRVCGEPRRGHECTGPQNKT